MASDLALYSLSNSNMPRAQKKSIMRELMGHIGKVKAPRAGHVLHTGAQAVAGSGVSLVTGGILGAVHATAKNGLDLGGHAPADVLLGIAGPVIAAFTEEHPVTCMVALDAGKSGFSVFGFRETYGLIAEKKLQRGGTPGGTFKPLTSKLMKASPSLPATKGGASKAHGDDAGEDPILAIAKRRNFNR